MIAQPESSTTEAKQYSPELTITNNYADKSRTLNTSDGPSEQEVSPSETHSFSTEENTTPTTLSNNAQPLKTYATIVNPTDIPLLQEFDISIEDLRFTVQATATTHFTNPSGGADEQQKLASSLIADCNSYTFARSAEDVGGPSTLQFDLEAAVRTANDTVSGCFSVYESLWR